MKWSRIRKLTLKLLAVYAAAVVLIAFADPKPDRPPFWIGAGLILAGQIVRIWATGHLVKNKRLTTTGPYAFVKNPLYVGTFLIMVGFCTMAEGGRYGHWALDNMNWILLGAGVLAFVARYVPYKKKREGDRLREIFGADWDEYDRNVPDYFPRLTPYVHPNGQPMRWSFRAVCDNSEPWTPLAVGAGIAAMLFNQPILDFVLRHVG